LLQNQARLSILILTVMVTTLACQNQCKALDFIVLRTFITNLQCIIRVEGSTNRLHKVLSFFYLDIGIVFE